MRVEDYIRLKGLSKVSIVKETVIREEVKDSDNNILEPREERDVIYIKQKKWNPETGEAFEDSKVEITLDYYEKELAFVNDEITSCTNKKTGLEKIIEDIKAL